VIDSIIINDVAAVKLTFTFFCFVVFCFKRTTKHSEQIHQQWLTALKNSSRNAACILDIKCSVALKLQRATFFIKKGALVKNWKKRYFVLEGNILWYYKEPSVSKSEKGKLELSGAIVRKIVIKQSPNETKLQYTLTVEWYVYTHTHITNNN